jgi:hypothetical protein
MSKPPSLVSTSRYETSHWWTSCNGLAPKIKNLKHLWHRSTFFKHRHLTYHFHDLQIKHGTRSAFAAKRSFRLLHKVACRLNIHDDKWIFDPKWKEHQAQIKQDIAISTQNEQERHSTHKRGSYSIFMKRRHPQAYISQIYQEHRSTSYEHHKQSHNLVSSISWWQKHMSEAHLYGVC